VDYERKKVAKKERVIIVVCLLKLLISKSKGPNTMGEMVKPVSN